LTQARRVAGGGRETREARPEGQVCAHPLPQDLDPSDARIALSFSRALSLSLSLSLRLTLSLTISLSLARALSLSLSLSSPPPLSACDAGGGRETPEARPEGQV